MGMKWPNRVRNDQIENKNGYEMTKMVLNDLGTKWPGYEMIGYLWFRIITASVLSCQIFPILRYILFTLSAPLKDSSSVSMGGESDVSVDKRSRRRECIFINLAILLGIALVAVLVYFTGNIIEPPHDKTNKVA